jgi:hypothetical protein
MVRYSLPYPLCTKLTSFPKQICRMATPSTLRKTPTSVLSPFNAAPVAAPLLTTSIMVSFTTRSTNVPFPGPSRFYPK